MNECNKTVKAVPLQQALLIFGVPGMAIYLGVHYLVPIWVGAGISLVFAWSLAVVGPTILNAIVVLGLYFFTERPTKKQFISRFRLQKPSKQLIWQVPLTTIAIALLNDLFAWTVPYLAHSAG